MPDNYSQVSFAWTNVVNAKPIATALKPGELVLNRAEGELYFRDSKDNIGTFYSDKSFEKGLQESQVWIDLTQDFQFHIEDFNNPHQVTAAQVGSYTKNEADSEIDSAKQALQSNIDDVEEKIDELPKNDLTLEENLFVDKNVEIGGQIYSNIYNLGTGGTITPNLNNSNYFRLTRNSTITLQNPTNIEATTYELLIHKGNDASINWGSSYKFPNDEDPDFGDEDIVIIRMIGDPANGVLYCSAEFPLRSFATDEDFGMPETFSGSLSTNNAPEISSTSTFRGWSYPGTTVIAQHSSISETFQTEDFTPSKPIYYNLGIASKSISGRFRGWFSVTFRVFKYLTETSFEEVDTISAQTKSRSTVWFLPNNIRILWPNQRYFIQVRYNGTGYISFAKREPRF